ncbi:MAG: hypothetical protein RJA25_407 [Bacteroidota bacterium]|jgi:hypothetical protein
MFKYLALTIAIELPIYFLFNRNRVLFSILILVMANFFTWPILNILYHTTDIPLFILESGVTLTEAFIIYFFLEQKFSKAFLISFIQNTTSTLIGIYINHL